MHKVVLPYMEEEGPLMFDSSELSYHTFWDLRLFYTDIAKTFENQGH